LYEPATLHLPEHSSQGKLSKRSCDSVPEFHSRRQVTAAQIVTQMILVVYMFWLVTAGIALVYSHAGADNEV
jgi:hypothetical protein